MNDGYYTSVVCLSGHALTRKKETYPEMATKHCSKCGAETIEACQSCNQHIRGAWIKSNVSIIGSIPPPRYCHECGKPYPWTEAAISAAESLALEAEELSSDEQELLAESVHDLIQESPKTQVAVVRSRRLLEKAGKATGKLFHDLLVDVVSESVKKALWGPLS